MERTAPVLRIEKISLQDGAGLRTVVFFKGCPLRCAWCSTPESQHARKERYYQKIKCTGCGRCVRSCPAHALSLQGGSVVWDGGKCRQCLRCAEVCPAQATRVYGRDMTVREVMRQIHRDELFFFHSGGGVTLSGGDVLCYPDFAQELLRECKDSAIHTAAELTMYGDYGRIAMLFPWLDAALIDLKVIDPVQHEKWTGVKNDGILANIRRAAEEFPGVPMHFRIPLIEGVNASEENLLRTAAFCERLPGCRDIEFLPYHRLGQATYAYLSREYGMGQMDSMPVQRARELTECLRRRDWPFDIRISGELEKPAAGAAPVSPLRSSRS